MEVVEAGEEAVVVAVVVEVGVLVVVAAADLPQLLAFSHLVQQRSLAVGQHLALCEHPAHSAEKFRVGRYRAQREAEAAAGDEAPRVDGVTTSEER